MRCLHTYIHVRLYIIMTMMVNGIVYHINWLKAHPIQFYSPMVTWFLISNTGICNPMLKRQPNIMFGIIFAEKQSYFAKLFSTSYGKNLF